MPRVKLKKNEAFDVLIRRWVRAVQKANIMKELKRREYYDKNK